MNPRNHIRPATLLLGSALALFSANPQSALASATATVFSRTNFTQSASDSHTVLVGATSAGVSGAQTDGTFSHSFDANVTANGDNGKISAATSDTTIGSGDLASSFAEGIVFDTLTFSGPGSANVLLSFSMNGSFNNTGGSSSLSATIQLQVLNLKDLTATASWTDNGPGSLVTYGSSIASSPDEIILPTLAADRQTDNVHATINEQFSINPGDVWTIRGRMRVTGNAGTDSIAVAQFAHTAQLALTLPAGWSFTSDSGTFLTTTSTPEPTSLTLLALSAGMILRRKKNKNH